MEVAISVCLSISRSKYLQSLIYVGHNLGLSLITLTNCCSKLFKRALLSPFWNGIKMGDP